MAKCVMLVQEHFKQISYDFTWKNMLFLTRILCRGTWKDKTFKEYNFNALGVMPPCGHLHPLLKVRAEYRQIFLEMGLGLAFTLIHLLEQ